MKPIEIGTTIIGAGFPCFIIAEAGANHDGDLGKALRLVDAAADARVDAVKFQTFKGHKLASTAAPKADYQRATPSDQESQVEMLRRLELSAQDHRELAAHCHERGLRFASTPFDEESADLLSELNVPFFKISSGDITNLPLISHVASKHKPIILSTGMASLGEVEAAVREVELTGNHSLVLLHCVSSYPADPADCNLRAMHTMEVAFGFPVGFSDHTLGSDVGVAAVAMGACVIEKHFTLDRCAPGPDHAASLEPNELSSFVQSIRRVEGALGNGRKEAAPAEADTAAVARKSLIAAVNVPAGTELTAPMIAIKRPGTGLPPAFRPFLMGRRALRDIPEGTLLSLELFG